MNRRGFLGSIIAACAAPAIVRADSLMRIIPAETLVFRAEAGELIAATDALWLGAIREWSAYDIRTDEKITRLDVIVRRPDGSPEQLTVSVSEYPGSHSDRDAALALLKSTAARAGKPVRGILTIPRGGEGRII